ncbi:hypothetical protein Anas_14522 [Armadillidium nasatum]|uniref:Uncharacterized protein n=1 Tax=Armadillidium nasatum TaxID=96803 RepID=A0A5N5SLZ5_9CRUS|nr:hypothetical protein Anas_14522 [Armadillidium nasatum]
MDLKCIVLLVIIGYVSSQEGHPPEERCQCFSHKENPSPELKRLLKTKLSSFNFCIETEGSEQPESEKGKYKPKEPKGHHSTGQGKDRPSLFEGMQKYLEGNQIPEPNIQNIWCCFGKNLTVVDENNIIVDKEIEIKLRDFYSDDPKVVDIMVSNIGTCKSELTQENTCNLNIFHDCLMKGCIAALSAQ